MDQFESASSAYAANPTPGQQHIMRIVILRTNGSQECFNVSSHEWVRLVDDYIGSRDVAPDTVALFDSEIARERYTMRKPVLICRGDGWETQTIEHAPGHYELRPVRARLPDNPVATELYQSVYRTNHRIVGDCALVDDDDFSG